MNYGYKKQLNISFTEAVREVREELTQEGFGILTEIDVKKTLEKKLGVAYGNYIILGACNPPFAYESLKAEKDIGMLLPCNIIIYEEGNQVFASAILPTVAMGMVDNPKLNRVARTVEEKLKKVIDNL